MNLLKLFNKPIHRQKKISNLVHWPTNPQPTKQKKNTKNDSNKVCQNPVKVDMKTNRYPQAMQCQTMTFTNNYFFPSSPTTPKQFFSVYLGTFKATKPNQTYFPIFEHKKKDDDTLYKLKPDYFYLRRFAKKFEGKRTITKRNNKRNDTHRPHKK